MPSAGKDLLKTTSEPVIKLRVRTERPVMDAFMATQKSDTVCNFGTSLREVDRPSDVPGPGTYNMRAITGVKGFESKIRSTPHFSLRGREKFGDPVPGGRGRDLEPGPGHYRPRVLGLAGDTPPEFSFPKALPQRDAKRMAPGPGEYKSVAAVGKQVLSTKKNHAPVGFGAGSRPPLILISTGDVGPGEYTQGPDACYKQVDSRKKSSGRVTFGTGGRHKVSAWLGCWVTGWVGWVAGWVAGSAGWLAGWLMRW